MCSIVFRRACRSSPASTERPTPTARCSMCSDGDSCWASSTPCNDGGSPDGGAPGFLPGSAVQEPAVVPVCQLDGYRPRCPEAGSGVSASHSSLKSSLLPQSEAFFGILVWGARL